MCRMFVNPPLGNEPFGESFVMTTDGARTRGGGFGLNMAGISWSLVILCGFSGAAYEHTTVLFI